MTLVTSADDDTARRTMVVLSSVSGHVHTPTNVCVGNAGEKWIREPDITEENELDVRKAQ